MNTNNFDANEIKILAGLDFTLSHSNDIHENYGAAIAELDIYNDDVCLGFRLRITKQDNNLQIGNSLLYSDADEIEASTYHYDEDLAAIDASSLAERIAELYDAAGYV